MLTLETWITSIPFVLSWFACGIYLAIVMGYVMAKADSADKAKVLDQLWKRDAKTDKAKS